MCFENSFDKLEPCLRPVPKALVSCVLPSATNCFRFSFLTARFLRHYSGQNNSLTHSNFSLTGQLPLRVLHTCDLHGALRGYDYLADAPSQTTGLTRTASHIRTARAGAQNCLLFDTGDFLQGSPICDLAVERDPKGDKTHPMITAMNALDYDAITPGNHDFDYGAAFFFNVLKKARFPVVCSNFLASPDTPAPTLPPHVLLTRSFVDHSGAPVTLRIGVTGALPPQTLAWDHHLAAHYTMPDMVTALRDQAAQLRVAGADIIVALAHCGIDPNAPSINAENALIEIAAIDEIDIVLGGHTHITFPLNHQPDHPAIDPEKGTIHGTPVLLSGFWGNHLGQLDVTLARDPQGAWEIATSRASLLPVATRDAHGQIISTTPEDPALLAVTANDHDTTMRYICHPVGETTTPLHSYFSLLCNDSALQIVADAQAHALRDAVDETDLATLPILSSAAPLKTGRLSGPDHYTHVPPGRLTRRNIADLYYYPNTLCGLRITGAGLRDWLEHSASLFSTIHPGAQADTPLLDAGFPGYKFEVICGLTYQIDVSQPPRFDAACNRINPDASRIRHLRWNGQSVTDDQAFLLASNDYRAFGIGLEMFPACSRPEIVFESPRSTRDILQSYLSDVQNPLSHHTRNVWSFSPLGGARALFESSPKARAYLDHPNLPPLQDLGDNAQGFAQFRVTL